jgi:cytoskeletal protein CcmA (bactofilin family)
MYRSTIVMVSIPEEGKRMFGGRKTQSSPANPAPSTPATTGQQSSAQLPRQQVGIETVLGPNTTFKGDLKSKANVRIDGQFEGDIDIEGNILVGETAHVTAEIQARLEVKVAGAVRGNIHGRKVHLARTGRVWGDITATSLTTEDGAFIDGRITMTGHPAVTQGFSAALPAPEVSLLHPMSEEGHETVEAEVVDDEPPGEHPNG